ncbi:MULTISPECIES: putative mucin/carbohydrate-binding domain-containing protein [unclassified Enterococcus]|uniref:putative mucin/carbohydrate-binding domain-containing protein n=1 Tax=unclassified Enterococcus TaxID=2608891 RepID=UPI002D806423|nr:MULTISPECIES: putative mucin/carbohydrate-binding domain-containing protein [unclassified Enterococcus]MEB4746596.1 BspA family leucine-rich repeat surface protein [Enterococcus sp. E5-168]MEB4754165.1 BspA family leucine-rich repeat surface protein [Enterococcus sp. E5-118]
MKKITIKLSLCLLLFNSLSFPFSVLTKADENHSNFNKTEDVIKKTENSLYSEKQNYENENLDKDTDKTAENANNEEKYDSNEHRISNIDNTIEENAKSKITEKSQETNVYDYTFLGLGDWTFGNMSYSDKRKLTIKYNSGSPHSGFGEQIYASIKVMKSDGTVMYNKEIKGNDYLANDQREFDLNPGDQIYIYHAEPNRLRVNDNSLKSEDKDIKTFYYVVSDDNKFNNFTDVNYLREKVNSLFTDDTHTILSPETNFLIINDLQNKLDNSIYKITEEDKNELNTLLQKAIVLLNELGGVISHDELINKEIFLLPEPKNLLGEGRKMAAYHDRQDLGIVLEGKTKIKIRQSNESYKKKVKLRLLGNDSKLEKEKDIGINWEEIEINNSLVPFIDTPFEDENSAIKPKIEMMVMEGVAKKIPVYNEASQKEIFINDWNNKRTSFSIIKGNKFQMLVPVIDLSIVKKIDIDSLISQYDNELFKLFDELNGTEKNSTNPLHEEEKQRYFIKADAHGAGSAYYGSNWTAQNDTTMESYLSMNWIPLHEIGHGYEIPSKEMYIIDVLNNIYGTIYQDKYLEDFLGKSWVFDGKKTERINEVANKLLIEKSGYNNQSYQGKLLCLLSIIDKMTTEGFSKFNRYHRELANQGKDASDLVKLFIDFCKENYNYNLVPYFKLLKLTIDDKTANKFLTNGSNPVAMLAQVVPEEKMDEAIEKLGFNTNLKSKLSLVSNDDIKDLKLNSNIHVTFKNFDLVKGSKLLIKDGNKVVKEIIINSKDMDIQGMPNGIYTVETDSKYTIFEDPYVYIKKDNETLNLSPINNYILQRVQELYSDTRYNELSNEITQEKIDTAKMLVNELEEGEQKKENLSLVIAAQDKLKQWTMKGLSEGIFATLRYFEDNTGKLLFTTENLQPHYLYGDVNYLSLYIVNSMGKTIYSRNIKATENLTKETINWNLEPGDKIFITHVEPNRLHVNDPALKNNNSQLTSSYQVNSDKKITLINQEWDFKLEDKKIVLTKYIGNSKNIVVPTEYNNIPIELKEINRFSIPNDIETFKIEKNKNKKVLLQNKTLKSAFEGFNNLIEVDLSNLDTDGVVDLSTTFASCPKLTSVNLSGLDTSNVNTMHDMFSRCSSLKNVDLSGFNTANVTDMQGIFFQCSNLTDIDVSSWDTKKVTTFQGTFQECRNLNEIDLSNFDTSNADTMDYMFEGCNNLKVLDLSSFTLKNGVSVSRIFRTPESTELLVLTNDQKLKELNYTELNRKPLNGPIFDANGGEFENNQSIKKYFEQCVYSPNKIRLEEFEKFKNNNLPVKEYSLFRGWNEVPVTKNDGSVLDLLDMKYKAKWKNMICNTTIDNKKIETQEAIGFVYIPDKLITPKTSLNHAGEQKILFNKVHSLNIGIRDLSQSQSSWNVTGQLKWSGKKIPGAYVQIDSNSNSVKKNINNNINEFDSKQDLVDAEGEVVSSQNDEGHLDIVNNRTTILMNSSPNKKHDSIYDYDLGKACLVIPETEEVQEGQYDANLEWNLSNAPQ